MDPKLITPVLASALVIWAVYRRIRRTFGRQPVYPRRLYLRAGFLGAVCALLCVVLARHPELLAILLAGVLAGAALGHLGVRHTKFETDGGKRYYTPHTYIGALVTAIFLARILYRFFELYSGAYTHAYAAQTTIQGRTTDPFATYQHSPLTLAVFGLLIGYYVWFNLGVLRRSRATSG